MDRLEGTKNLGFLTGDLLDRKLSLGYMGVKCKKIEDESVPMEEEREEEEVIVEILLKFEEIL